MRLEDYQRKVFDDFLGLYSRGEMDQVPEDHFSDCLNIDYDIGEWRTRPGLVPHIPLGYASGKVNRIVTFTDNIIGPLILILDEAGNLYTFSARLGDSATIPRLTVVGATDFSAIKLLGKIFIAFHNGQSGLLGQNLKIFIPGAAPALDEFRDAGGLAPISAIPITAADGAGGIVNAGTYKIAVSFVTSSGFITQPGPKILSVFTPTTYVSPGAVKIDLSDIPTGPPGTIQRQILITKAGLEEYFFLASDFGGVINDNISTTATLDFDDTTDLVNSADYLFDLLETIPSPLTLIDYNGRLCIAGEAGNQTIVRASISGEPESFDAVDGFININKDDGFTIRNMIVLRSSLYIWKNLGVHFVIDNGDFPSTWTKPIPVDGTINTSVHGIAVFFDISNIRTARDWTLFADKSGILLFDGAARKPPITDKINNIWQSINFDQFHKIVLAVDDQLHKIYCAIPINASANNNKLLVADYNSCPGKIPESESIKWSIWEFNPCETFRNPTYVGLFGFPPDVVPTFKFASSDGGGYIYSLNPSSSTDDNSNIESFFKTSLVFWESGQVHFFTAARLRVVGSGVILCSAQGEDEILSANLPSIPLSTIDYRFVSEFITGIDGVRTAFTLCRAPSTSFIMGFQNGLLLKEGVDFTRVGTAITLLCPTALGDTIQFLYCLGSIATTLNLETPGGAIDGVNTTFNLSFVPTSGVLLGFQNGLLIKNGLDYTLAGQIVTMTVPPSIGDSLQFFYRYNNLEAGFLLETPSEAINGINTSFNLVNKPGDNFVAVFQNGLLLKYLLNFYIVNNTIIFFQPPQPGDTLQFLYRADSKINPGTEKLIRFNFQNEKAKIQFRLASGRFVISKLELFGKPVYEMRPA